MYSRESEAKRRKSEAVWCWRSAVKQNKTGKKTVAGGGEVAEIGGVCTGGMKGKEWTLNMEGSPLYEVEVCWGVP